MCPYFEMRIKGMKEFKYIQEKVVNSILKNNQENLKANLDFAKYLDLKLFSNWIIKNNTIEYIFKENPHQELIKRSYQILYILAQNEETLPESMLELIWSCCSSQKHEDIIRASYELITELSKFMPLSRLKYFFI